jgi:hypothetical protein
MLIMAVSGAAVLALVCWAALRESAPEPFIPQTTPDRHVDEDEGERGRGSGGSNGHADVTPSRPLAGAVTANTDELHNTTFADADTDQAIAAAAALWNVITQDQE